MAVPYFERMIVADIAALKALTGSTTPAIADGIFVAVANRGDGVPDWYRYNAAGTGTESLPAIVTPTTAPGRWFKFSKDSPIQITNNRDSPPIYGNQNTAGISFSVETYTEYGSPGLYLYMGVDTTGGNYNNGWQRIN